MHTMFQRLLSRLNLYAPHRAERDPGFAQYLAETTRRGMRLGGVLGMIGPPIYAFGTALALHWDMTMSVDARSGTLAVWVPLSASAVGIAIQGLSFWPRAVRWGRPIVGVALMAIAYLSSLEFAAAGVHHPSKFGILSLLMLVGISTMPFRAWQTTILGFLLMMTYGLTALVIPGQHGHNPLDVFPELPVFMLTLTVMCAGISALLYSIRHRDYAVRREEESLRHKLQDSERRYRSIFEDSSDGLFVYSEATSGFPLVNAVTEHILGRSAEELAATHFSKVIHPDDLARVAGIHAARVRGEPAPSRYRLKLKRPDDDAPVICEMTIHTTGDPSITAGALRDITAQVKLEEENAQLAQLSETNPFPVLRFDDIGGLLYMNPAARRFPSEIGHPEALITDLLPPDFERRIARLIESDTTVIDARHDFDDRVFSITYRPLPATREIFVWIVDATERTRAEEQIRAYAFQLEQANQELREAQAQLVQSEKMAALGNLVAGVAHEINTPLGSIHANADVSRRALELLAAVDSGGGDNQRMAQAVRILTESNETTRTASERIIRIVRSLRNFARLDEAEFKDVDLHEGIESTLTLAHHEYKNRIEIVKEYGSLPPVRCNPNQINQVIMNILVNAIHAIHDKGTITIRTSADSDGVHVAISDTGVGIRPEYLPRIFDPGFTTKGVGVGTGLGLSIVYKIVQSHGGKIDVKSRPGAGSTFTLTLPVGSAKRSTDGEGT